jgi:hypothetical protein
VPARRHSRTRKGFTTPRRHNKTRCDTEGGGMDDGSSGPDRHSTPIRQFSGESSTSRRHIDDDAAARFVVLGGGIKGQRSRASLGRKAPPTRMAGGRERLVANVKYFDYEKTAREAQMPPQRLDELRDMVRQEFPRDEMMYELHLLRACMAVRDGVLSIDEALRQEPSLRT